MENADDLEAHVFGHDAEGREFALRAGDEHDGADGRAEFVGHVLAENDGWQAIEASSLSRRVEEASVLLFRRVGIELLSGASMAQKLART